jgi:heat shock protein HslJ
LVADLRARGAEQDGRDPVLQAAVEVLAAEAVKTATGQLAGANWRLERIFAAPGARTLTEAPEGCTIAFADDGSLSIKTGCNVSKASCQVGAGGALKITPTISTLAVCPETSLGDEFVTWLAASQRFQIDSEITCPSA